MFFFTSINDDKKIVLLFFISLRDFSIYLCDECDDEYGGRWKNLILSFSVNN